MIGRSHFGFNMTMNKLSVYMAVTVVSLHLFKITVLQGSCVAQCFSVQWHVIEDLAKMSPLVCLPSVFCP